MPTTATSSLQDILGYANLCGIIESVKPGVPDVLPPAFMSTTKKVEGDAGRYTVTQGVRTVSKRVEYGAPAIRVDPTGISVKDVKLVHTFEEIHFNPNTYRLLRAFDSYEKQQQGKEIVALQMRNFKQRQTNHRISSVLSMLFLTHIYYDADGSLLPTSSGAEIDVDMLVPSGNKAQLNVDGTGDIIGASWATSTTNIPLHLRKLKKAALRLTGYPLKYAYYGVNIPEYMMINDRVKYFLARNPDKAAKWLDSGEIPDGLFGFTWIPAYESFFEDSAGSNQTFVGDDAIAFSPEISEDSYQLLQGTMGVPTTFQPQMDPQNPIGSVQDIEGMFAYGVPTHNPLGATAYAGDTWLPVMKVPGAFFVADVTP